MKRLFKKLFGLLSILGLGVTTLISCSSSDSGKVVIKAETNATPAPFSYTVDKKEDSLYETKDGVYLAGYDIAVITEIFKLPEFADYELDLSVGNAREDAQQGIIDFAINNYSYNEERSKTFLYSYPYTKSRYTITTKKGVVIDSFEELAESGLVIYGQAGGNTTNAIERYNDKRKDGEKKINLVYTSADITIQLQEALDGKTALIHDQPVILKYKQSYPNQFESLNINVLSDLETETNITANNTSHLLFGKTGANSEKYRELLSNGIKTLYDNGTLEDIGKKWIAEALGDDSISVLPNESDFKYLN